MAWRVRTTIGELSWGEAGLSGDELALESFRSWCSWMGAVSATPTGPTIITDPPPTEELPAWWAVVRWLAYEDLQVTAEEPPADPEALWAADDAPDGAAY